MAFGLIIGAILGLLFAKIEAKTFIDYFEREFYTILLLVLFLIALLLVLYIFQERITKKIFGIAASNSENAIDGVASFTEEIIHGDRKVAKEKSILVIREIAGLYSSWTFRTWVFQTLIGLIIVMAGMFGTYVLIEQNKLITEQSEAINKQTTKLKEQNQLIDEQNTQVKLQNSLIKSQYQSSVLQLFLQEASRRTVLAPTVAQLISDINNHKPSEDDINEEGIFHLSEDLYRRITTLTSILKPYIIVELKSSDLNLDGSLTDNAKTLYLSPERGQILQALISAGVNVNYLNNADFSYADMRIFTYDPYENTDAFWQCEIKNNDVSLREIHNIRLDNTDFSDANISHISMAINNSFILNNTTFSLSNLDINLSKNSDQKSFKNTVFSQSKITVLEQVNLSLKGIQIHNDAEKCFTISASLDEDEDEKVNLKGLEIHVTDKQNLSEDTLVDYVFDTYFINETQFQKTKYEINIQSRSPQDDNTSIITFE